MISMSSAWLGDMSFVHLWREDVLAQAVSVFLT